MVELKGKQLLVATILNLLILGVLSYNSLPEAYCSLEDKTVKYIHMSATQKTVTKVTLTPDEDGYVVSGDRCQKGMTIGQWIPNEYVKSEGDIKDFNFIVIAYTDNGKYICNGYEDGSSCINSDLEQVPIEWLE